MDAVKDLFYELRAMTAITPVSAFLIPYGDFNDHGGSIGSGCKEVHGGCWYDKPVPDIEMHWRMTVLCNTCLKKRNRHLITYRSCNTATQIDFVLSQKSIVSFLLM